MLFIVKLIVFDFNSFAYRLYYLDYLASNFIYPLAWLFRNSPEYLDHQSYHPWKCLGDLVGRADPCVAPRREHTPRDGGGDGGRAAPDHANVHNRGVGGARGGGGRRQEWRLSRKQQAEE